MKHIYSGLVVLLAVFMVVTYGHAEINIPTGIEPVGFDYNNTNDPVVVNNEYLTNMNVRIHFITSENLLDLSSQYFNDPTSIMAMIYPTNNTCDIFIVEWKDWNDLYPFIYFGQALRICIEPNSGTSPDFN
jgi:hypothetical protein